MLAVLAICTGASLGALLRWQLGLWLTAPGQLPWGTLAANAIGGYGIGLAIAWLDASPQLDPVWRLAIITGFLGALTTFSSFSAEVVGLLQAQRTAGRTVTANDTVLQALRRKRAATLARDFLQQMHALGMTAAEVETLLRETETSEKE